MKKTLVLLIIAFARPIFANNTYFTDFQPPNAAVQKAIPKKEDPPKPHTPPPPMPIHKYDNPDDLDNDIGDYNHPNQDADKGKEP